MYVNERLGYCWPTDNQLSELSGDISISQIRRYLKELESCKIIRRETSIHEKITKRRIYICPENEWIL